MIVEFIDSLRCYCPKPYRQFGFHRELAAIHARRRRCQVDWQLHEQACHDFILKYSSHGDVAVLLGAGLCFDLPIRDLLTSYNEIWLVDVAFHPSTRALARKHATIKLIPADLTGMLETEYLKNPDQVPQPDLWLSEPAIDLVVSANLITQLPLPFLGNGLSLSDQATLQSALHAAHIDWLRKFRCPTILIAETETRRKNLTTAATDILPAYKAGLLENPDKTWSWRIAPAGEIARHLETELTIGAWRQLPPDLA